MIAEYINHLAYGLTLECWLLDDFHLDNLPTGGTVNGVLRDKNILRDAFVIGDHHSHTAFDEQAPDDELVGPLEHTDDRAFQTTASINTRNPNHRLVTVQQRAHLAGMKEQIIPTGFGYQKTVTVRMGNHATAHQV